MYVVSIVDKYKEPHTIEVEKVYYDEFVKAMRLFCEDNIMWVSVNIETSTVVLYIEYKCGGEVATHKFTIDCNFTENLDEFIAKLDDEITDYAKMYE